MMDFSYEDHQLDLQQAARRLFAGRCPTSVVRDVEAGTVGYLPDLWQELADLGWIGLAFPAAYGGGTAGSSTCSPSTRKWAASSSRAPTSTPWPSGPMSS